MSMEKQGKTRVHELLGVDIAEQFNISGRGTTIFSINPAGALFEERPYETALYHMTSSCLLANLINDPSLIIRRPRLTDEQREVLAWLQKGRFTHVCIDPDKEMTAYDQMPRRQSGGWFASEDDYAGVFGRVIEPLRPLIPDWTIPLDVKKALEGGGQG